MQGGACYVDANGQAPRIFTFSSGASVLVSNVRFTGVRGSEQGAVLVEGGGKARFTYCDFASNEGASGAGATVQDPGTHAGEPGWGSVGRSAA